MGAADEIAERGTFGAFADLESYEAVNALFRR
jgi:hypothetical protein